MISSNRRPIRLQISRSRRQDVHQSTDLTHRPNGQTAGNNLPISRVFDNNQRQQADTTTSFLSSKLACSCVASNLSTLPQRKQSNSFELLQRRKSLSWTNGKILCYYLYTVINSLQRQLRAVCSVRLLIITLNSFYGLLQKLHWRWPQYLSSFSYVSVRSEYPWLTQ